MRQPQLQYNFDSPTYGISQFLQYLMFDSKDSWMNHFQSYYDRNGMCIKYAKILKMNACLPTYYLNDTRRNQKHLIWGVWKGQGF